MFNLSIMSSNEIKIPAVTHGHPLFCSINDSKKLFVLCWVRQRSDEHWGSGLNNCICLPDPWAANKELRKNCRITFIFVLGFLFIGRLAPEIQGQILQCGECSQLRVLCAAQETLNILQNGIFAMIWVCFCEHLPFLYRVLKSNSRDR